MLIIDTDNFGGDYPDERFVNQYGKLTKQRKDALTASKEICEVVVNMHNGPKEGWDTMFRYWKVVPDDYKLQPGFEP